MLQFNYTLDDSKTITFDLTTNVAYLLDGGVNSKSSIIYDIIEQRKGYNYFSCKFKI